MRLSQKQRLAPVLEPEMAALPILAAMHAADDDEERIYIVVRAPVLGTPTSGQYFVASDDPIEKAIRLTATDGITREVWAARRGRGCAIGVKLLQQVTATN